MCYIGPKRRQTKREERKRIEKEMERNLDEIDQHNQLGPGADNIIDKSGGPKSLSGGTRV